MNTQSADPQALHILAAAITVVGAILAILQYRLAALKWRLELYDKRYPVYLATMDYIAAVVRDAKIPLDRSFQFLRESRDKEFLFGSEVQEYLKELYKKGIELRSCQQTYESLPVGAERSAHVEKEAAILEWFATQFEECKTLLLPYLRIWQK